MSNIDFSAKHPSFSGVGSTGSTKKKLQLVLNVALITAAFLFVAAAVIGVFP